MQLKKEAYFTLECIAHYVSKRARSF